MMTKNVQIRRSEYPLFTIKDNILHEGLSFIKDIIKDTINTDVVIIGIENMAQQLFADIPRTFGNRISSTNVCVK